MSLAIPFKQHIDLDRNELRSFSLENRAVAPTGGTIPNGMTYYDTVLNAQMIYDSTRVAFLSASQMKVQLGRLGGVGVGLSLRGAGNVPLSASPYILPRNMTLVGIAASTSSNERFVLRVEDVAGGSSAFVEIPYEAAGPSSTQSLINNSLNVAFNAGDALDAFILSSVTGVIDDPMVTLVFKLRK